MSDLQGLKDVQPVREQYCGQKESACLAEELFRQKNPSFDKFSKIAKAAYMLKDVGALCI